MKISYKLDSQGCSTSIKDLKRLKALSETGQMGSGTDEAFDRLTFLAAKLLNVPLTIVSFVSDKKQYFKSFHGLPEPWSTEREIPLDVSVCQYTLVGNVLSLKDASQHPLLSNNPALEALNLVGYLGVPLIDKEGNNLGAFCAISNQPREWSDNDIEVLKVLTKSVMTEIELGKKVRALEEEKKQKETTLALLTHDIRSPIATAHSFSTIALEKDDKQLTLEALSSIKRTTAETLHLIDNLLDWKKESLVELNDKNKSYFDFLEPLEIILSDYEKSSEVKFLKKIRSKDLKVYGNESILRRAIRNLVDNAVKYGDLRKEITVEVDRTQEVLTFKIHNYGPEIPKKRLESLFNINKTYNSKTEKPSWGFGLPQVANTASAHYGAVKVDSSEKLGTTFTFTISNQPN